MISAGRWVISILFGLAGVFQLGSGILYVAGVVRPQLPPGGLPPGQEELVIRIAGVFAIVIGGVVTATAWGLFNWRNWARIVAIVICFFNLLGLVLVSFQMKLALGPALSGLATAAILVWLFSSGVQAAFSGEARQEA